MTIETLHDIGDIVLIKGKKSAQVQEIIIGIYGKHQTGDWIEDFNGKTYPPYEFHSIREVYKVDSGKKELEEFERDELWPAWRFYTGDIVLYQGRIWGVETESDDDVPLFNGDEKCTAPASEVKIIRGPR